MLDKLFATFVSGAVLYLGWKLGEKILKHSAPHVSKWWDEGMQEMKEEEEAKKVN